MTALMWHPRVTDRRLRDLCADRPVVITGAGSGMGRELACRLARCGAVLELSDVDGAGLESTAALCRRPGTSVRTHRVDVVDMQAVRDHADDVVARRGPPSLVVNNAGITMVAGILDEDDEYSRRVMSVNFTGMVNGTRAFLPYLRRAGGGHIVNMSSAFGLLGSPAQASYCASKFAVRGFTQTVQDELRAAKSGVGVHVVYPGAVHTPIARTARYMDPGVRDYVTHGFDRRLPGTRPAAAAVAILAGVLAGRDRILVGIDARAIDIIARVFAGEVLRPLGILERPVFGPVVGRRDG
ncbi:SDR family oxidoreductase [Gordonia sp. OPL2]|uniref:SDR family NAD(P)-dependent oxidoreductase n=1 Tax=Gordonia sp. OPL2 TaxID=2486274 RepID=UPI0016551172|nr:SDR family oxidoreductase [Gordonia sp. OPL2]ROZ89203.1 SDR family oxidoreductase [Gordonia sp. OPL2]